MKTTLELNIHELAQVLNDGSLATLAESVKSLESNSFNQANTEFLEMNQPISAAELPGQTQMNIPQQTTVDTNPSVQSVTPVPTQGAPVVQPTAVPVVSQYNAQQVPPTPVQQNIPPVQAAPTTVPTATATYTLQQLALAGTQLVDAGRRDEVLALLSAFGVNALTELPKEQYGAYATKLREMGAKI